MNTTHRNQDSLATYYRWHAGMYDLTRWAFLFGRNPLIHKAAYRLVRPARILEIGCGTGNNLVELAQQFPDAQIIGLDLSQDMLDRARVKVQRYGSRMRLMHRAYDAPVAEGSKFDLIVLSYSLSMINPGYDEVLQICKSDLSATGLVAVVDFHESRWGWFRRWMAVNHVRMEGHVLDELRKHFQPCVCEVHRGYGDLWRYMLFIGK
ncbi:MAG: class I SAM-dependent methyltransferase [Verrucomicrobiota bacterium]